MCHNSTPICWWCCMVLVSRPIHSSYISIFQVPHDILVYQYIQGVRVGTRDHRAARPGGARPGPGLRCGNWQPEAHRDWRAQRLTGSRRCLSDTLWHFQYVISIMTLLWHYYCHYYFYKSRTIIAHYSRGPEIVTATEIGNLILKFDSKHFLIQTGNLRKWISLQKKSTSYSNDSKHSYYLGPPTVWGCWFHRIVCLLLSA